MIIALNHKCNMTKDEYIEYIDKLSNINTNHKLIVCPSFTNISHTPSNIIVGAQNVCSTGEGAYTGEISAKQLSSYNVTYTIVGHSERRNIESLEEVNNKVIELFNNNITPILCIGETEEERKDRNVEAVLEKELLSVIENLSKEQQDQLIVAYEPIWSIGTGIIPTTEEIKQVMQYIKSFLPNSKVLYGGSVNDENVDILKKIEEIDGYLIGGLGLKLDKLQVLLDKIS